MQLNERDDSPLARAIETMGGVPRASVTLGVSQQAIRKWLRAGRLPPERAPTIERLTAALGERVTCVDLCPAQYPNDLVRSLHSSVPRIANGNGRST